MFVQICPNRAYYACFHATIAVLARFGIEHPKHPHDWVHVAIPDEEIFGRICRFVLIFYGNYASKPCKQHKHSTYTKKEQR
jgi:hypothetical protein